MSRPASRARADSYLQPSAVKTDGLVMRLPALCHTMPRETTVKTCVRLRIHTRVHWDVGQTTKLGTSHSAPISSEPFATPKFLYRLGRSRVCFALPSHATVVSRRPTFLLTLLSFSPPVAPRPARLEIQGASEEAQRLWLSRGLHLSLAPPVLVPPGSAVLLRRRCRITPT